MALLLYINGQLTDLDAGQVIAQTKQVNDLNSLENRQASYTNKFKLPKTANNIRIMDFLTLAGNTSNIPYQKNECSLYSDTGECFVYNGWAVVTDGGDDYEVVVYDGIIDLYKAIENKTLADLGLTELKHEKNITEIIKTWFNGGIYPYKYILADFNGKSGYVEGSLPSINIDYLIPAVNVPWLFGKIFSSNNASYSGKIFESQDFKNLWMTYPVGLKTIENEDLLFESSKYNFIGESKQPYPYVRKFFAKYIETDEYSGGITNSNNIHLIVPETAKYKLEISGKLNTRKYLYDNQGNSLGTIPTSCSIIIGKNAQSKTPLTVIASETLINGQASNTPFTTSLFVTLNKNDAICLVIGAEQETPRQRFNIDSGSTLTVKLSKVETGVFDFDMAFSDFSMRDFLNEIIHRFGLTMYKDPYTGNYTFLTLRELLEESEIMNWSDKYVKRTSENYLYGNYAQQNWLRYNYNEKESSHNDGFIPVNNINLGLSRDIIKSKIYSPEKQQVDYLNRKTNVYKFWNKETEVNAETNEQTISYKALDKRYYFIREEKREGIILLKSDLLGGAVPYNSYFSESFAGLPFKDIINSYYTPIQKILNKACVVSADLFLKDTDVINFDFKKRYYIEQLGGNFIMNKITNYIPGKPVKCEMIRVQNQVPLIATGIRIRKIIVSLFTVRVFFELSTPANVVIFEYEKNDAWTALPIPAATNPWTQQFTEGEYSIQLRLAANEVSNKVTITIPSTQTLLFS